MFSNLTLWKLPTSQYVLSISLLILGLVLGLVYWHIARTLGTRRIARPVRPGFPVHGGSSGPRARVTHPPLTSAALRSGSGEAVGSMTFTLRAWHASDRRRIVDLTNLLKAPRMESASSKQTSVL